MKSLKILYCVLIVLVSPSILVADNYIIINQVMYDSPLNEKTNISPYSNGEFIELYNAGTSIASLQGWRIEGSGSSEIYYFSNGTSIPEEGYLILACRRGNNNTFQLSELYTLPNNSSETIVYQNKIILANGGETITLYNEHDEIVDQMRYDGNVNNAVLYATNLDGISGDSCITLHRIDVEFDATGKVIYGTSQWQSDTISFARCMLPHVSYQENYLLGEQSLPSSENYVLSVTPLDPVTRIGFDNGRVSVSSDVRTRTAIQYLDELGRLEQSILINATDDEQDIVSLVEYNGKNRQNKQWLPVVMQTEGQHPDISNIRSKTQSDYGDAFPYAEVQYEATARKIVSKQYQQGESYRGHYASKIYNVCDGTENVHIYIMKNDSVLKTTGANYAPYMLYKTTAIDEDGKSRTTYTDKLGRTVMDERHGNRTYYVYDNLGHLCVVLPNISPSKLSNGEYPFRNTTMQAIAYCYKYDASGNMIYKRLPGCEPQYMVYDEVGQLVLKQDGNQRATNKWVVYAYDSIGRTVYTAETVLTYTHEDLVCLFANKWQVEHFDPNQTNVLADIGYGSSILDPEGMKMLTVNYYDNYDFMALLPPSTGEMLSFNPESGYDQQYHNAIGLLTGTCVYNLSETGRSITTLFYDKRGHVIQKQSLSSDESITSENYAYLFDGSMAQQLANRQVKGKFIQDHYRYTYDKLGKPLKTFYKLNDGTEICLSELSYDNTGHLAQKLLYNQQDTITYSYDIRDMLIESHNKYFSEKLYYADSLGRLSSFATACYNGNIAASKLSYHDSIYTFSYTYDQLNRLTNSQQIEGNSQSINESYEYDAYGNILLLKRYNNHRLIDSLAYTYDNEGHKLLSIMDGGKNADLYDVTEYHNDIIFSDTTMRYDANGNIIYDANRGITAIHYNQLNLPDTIQFVNGNQIVNLYDAAGHKYKSVVYTVLSVPLTPYEEIMHYSYDTDTVEYWATEYVGNIEIRYTRRDTVQRVLNTIGYYADSSYYYTLKDHLGNICAVVNATSDTVVQRTIYYASGVSMAQSSGRDEQPYLYNGKEFIVAHGLNMYDYGFRGYYATIGRFTSMDPLCEQTPWFSPYSYAGNNFVNNVDWMGLGAYTTSDPNKIADLLSFLSGGGSINNYNTTGWLDITDEIERLSEEFGLGVIIGTNLTYANSGGGELLYGATVIAEVYNYASRYSYHEISSEISKIAQNALNIGTLGTTAWVSSQWNPYYWIGANGQLYTREFLHKQGGYANSFKRAGIRLNTSPVGKIGKGLGYLSLGINVINIYSDGLGVGTLLSTTVTAIGIWGGPWGILLATGYSLADIGIEYFTGRSLTDTLNDITIIDKTW